MPTSAKRATVYFEPFIHKALKLKSIETSKSISGLVNEAVRAALAEDADDIAAFEERAIESFPESSNLATILGPSDAKNSQTMNGTESVKGIIGSHIRFRTTGLRYG